MFEPTGTAYLTTGDTNPANAYMYASLWRISPSLQQTQLVMPFSTLYDPTGIARDASGNVFVADYGNKSLFAVGGLMDVPQSINPFPLGLAIDGTTAYVTTGHCIQVLPDDGAPPALVAGQCMNPGYLNAMGGTALFNNPNGLAVLPNSQLAVADTGNSCLRLVDPDAGSVSDYPGPLACAAAPYPYLGGIAADALGNLYALANNQLYEIYPDGGAIVLAGTGVAGSKDGSGCTATLNSTISPVPGSMPNANGIAIGPDGGIYFLDYNQGVLRVYTP